MPKFRVDLLVRLHSSAKTIWVLLLLLLPLIMISGCSSLPKDVERSPSFAYEQTVDTTLRRELATVIAQHPGLSGFHALSEGMDAFAARLRLVTAAEKTLDVQYYIWHDDLTGRVLYKLLLDAADRGVRVRLLLDDLDTAGKEEFLHLIDAHPNVEIRLFNPFANRGMRVGDFLTDIRRVNRRMHNKSLTADNQATVFGGRNIGDEYFDATEDLGFSDMDVLAVGPVVGEVSQAFDLYWNSQWVYPLSVFGKDDSLDEGQLQAFRQQVDTYSEKAKGSAYANALRSLELAHMESVNEFDFSWSKWALVYDQPSKVEAREVKADTHMAPKLKEGMDKTQQELIIVSPYFVPGTNFTEYLVGLVKKGVHVRIMTNSLAANDVSLVHSGYMRYRKDLIKGGVELYEYKPNKASQQDNSKKKAKWTGSSRASLHGKLFGFDKQYLFVGSFNLDARSVALNTEMGVYFEAPDYARQLSESFDTKAMVKGYRVQLSDDGDLHWITLEAGKEVRFDSEPETGFWKRFTTGFMSLFVPESQL